MTTEKAATRLRAKTDWERANDRAFLGIDERGQDVGKDPELMPSAQHSITMTPTDVARYVKKAVECLHQASQALGAATGKDRKSVV